MNFEFSTAGEIVFGEGTVARAGEIVARHGRRVLVVTGSHPERADRLLGILRGSGIDSHVVPVAGEPSTDNVEALVREAADFRAEAIVAFGGGSPIDAAKASAGLATNPGGLMEHLEVVGEGRPLARPALPWIAIPTTSGTGAEVTRNAVLTVKGRGLKVSLRSPHLMARAVIVDPDLTADLPVAVAAATGLDALTQLVEPYVCTRANPMTDALCASAIPGAARALVTLADGGMTAAGRRAMSWAALSSGMALANAGLGAVHGLASPIGGRTGAPHGAVCAALLGAVMAGNLSVLAARLPASPAVQRYAQVARWLTSNERAAAEDGVRWVRQVVASLRVPRLSHWGLAEGDIPGIASAALSASSMKANPVPLTAAELENVLREIF